MVKSPPANAGAVGSVLGLRRSSGRGNGTTAVFLPEESHGRGAWWAIVHGVAQESDTT